MTALERRYIGFDGLNLCWETLEGLVKHNGPLMLRDGSPTPRYRECGVPQAIELYGKRRDLELWSFASAEAQIAALNTELAKPQVEPSRLTQLAGQLADLQKQAASLKGLMK